MRCRSTATCPCSRTSPRTLPSSSASGTSSTRPRWGTTHRSLAARPRGRLDAGVRDEARRALAGPVSATARKTTGLDEIVALPREEAVAALVVRTRRYAAYQRKWMRRMPGLVMVEADRPPGEIADDIVALARTRARLSRR